MLINTAFAQCRMEYDDAGNPSDIKIITANRLFKKFPGLSESVGKNISTLLSKYPEEVEYILKKCNKVFTGGVIETFELYSDEYARWFYILAIANEESDFLIQIDDITEWKQETIALNNLTLQYKKVFEQLPTGIARIRPKYKDEEPVDFSFVYVNSAYEKLIGVVDITGKTFSEVYAHYPNFLQTRLDRCLKAYKDKNTDSHDLYSPITKKWVHWFISGSETKDIFIILEDITVQKKAELVFIKSENEYRKLFNQLEYGIAKVSLLLDDDEKITDLQFISVNPAFEEIMGYNISKERTFIQTLDGNQEVADGSLKIVEKVKDTGIPETFDTFWKHSKKWIHVNISKSDENELVFIVEKIPQKE